MHRKNTFTSLDSFNNDGILSHHTFLKEVNKSVLLDITDVVAVLIAEERIV